MTIQAIDDSASVNLKIAHIGSIASGTGFTADNAPTSNTSINNLVANSRGSYYESGTADHIYDFDFEGCTAFAADFVYLGNFKSVLDRWDVSTSDVRLRADNSTAYSNTLETNNITTSDLVGARGEDAYFTSNNSTSYTHYRVRMQTGAINAARIRLSKLIVCKLFDFGVDPEYSLRMTQGAGLNFQRATQKEYNFSWRGVSNDKLDTFNALIFPYLKQTGLVFYDVNDLIFAGDQVFFGFVQEYSHNSLSGNSNQVSMTVREVV